MRANRGFTLIELLIAVAIIAVLALIAVPNYLESQIRAKVARVHADQRTLMGAMSAYFVDHNDYPLDIGKLPPDGFWQSQFTTPIAYISGPLTDVFCASGDKVNRWYQYGHCEGMQSVIVVSIGPDLKDDFGEDMWGCGKAAMYSPLYDPSNGTVSVGDVWRINKELGPLPAGICAYR